MQKQNNMYLDNFRLKTLNQVIPYRLCLMTLPTCANRCLKKKEKKQSAYPVEQFLIEPIVFNVKITYKITLSKEVRKLVSSLRKPFNYTMIVCVLSFCVTKEW